MTEKTCPFKQAYCRQNCVAYDEDCERNCKIIDLLASILTALADLS